MNTGKAYVTPQTSTPVFKNDPSHKRTGNGVAINFRGADKRPKEILKNVPARGRRGAGPSAGPAARYEF
ncbi:hypothetical protein EVAR_3360_1 [Eumeta japonica]|uniref:Uncharacterized protein n=1 Tax=Eumeta variegata TaxID=151549 RepID=A0A4C1SSU4_EUMVA|nr:hypothetical protein EVAR_3360_1 [Eumeta japonica]